MRVVVLGAGFGGLEVTTLVSESLGSDANVTLIDQAEGFVFGFSKLDVMFGHAEAAGAVHRYAEVVKPGVTFVQSRIKAIDTDARTVHTEPVHTVGADAGTFGYDILVVALGADLDPAATPGLVEAGHEFYTVAGAFALRETLAAFEGGRVVVGVTSVPFKCPPAPSEAALLTHDLLVERGLRAASEISLVMPFGVPIPPSPDASGELLRTFAERNIAWVPERRVNALDAARNVALLSDGSELPFDLFLGVPKHVAPTVVVDAGLTDDDGWVAVDPLTLLTKVDDVYAVGDVTSVGTPKAGVFAEGQAAIVAHAIIERHHGREPQRVYDGHGVCYLEFGGGRVAEIDVTFPSDASPHGTMNGPSSMLVKHKADFATTRVQRWFDQP